MADLAANFQGENTYVSSDEDWYVEHDYLTPREVWLGMLTPLQPDLIPLTPLQPDLIPFAAGLRCVNETLGHIHMRRKRMIAEMLQLDSWRPFVCVKR